LTSPQAEQQPADELPDWLNWDAATEKPAASDSPDWQFEMDASQESASTPGEAASARNSDWLSEGSSTTSAESTSPVVSPFSFLEDDDTTAAFGLESDWSAGGLGEPAQAETPTSQPASDEPDWLSSLIAPDSAGPATPFDVGSGEGSFFSGEEADSTTSFFSDWGGAAQEQPDWLSADSGAQATNDQPASVPAFSFDEGGDAATPSSGLPLGAAPDWMSQVEAEDAAAPQLFPGGEEAPQDDESLERAHLPGWLEAMRPVDAIALEDFKDTSDERMETDGPLAGLRGALPVGIETSNLAAAAPHGLKLQISEETNNRVTMLNELLAAETQPRKAASMEFISGALIRLVLFVALMMAAIWALWYGEQPGTVYLKHSPLPPAAADFQQQMSFLPTEPVVLVAVEAEAAFSGEMDAAAEAVITYLAARRAQIVFVSTNTTGPILAEYYVENLNQQAARGSVGYGNYANLGLLPGGPAGLISFLNDPEQTTTLDLAGQPAWGSDSGSPSAGLSNFSAVIVLTANSETARLWIEQAGPLLRERGIPLLFGVSAQVAPILQPYYHAVPRQVDGILSGLPDVYQFASVNALAQLSGQPGEATQLVDAYSAVVMAAVLILLIGIAVNLMSTLLPARSKERKA
jgi:hypothetical protein